MSINVYLIISRLNALFEEEKMSGQLQEKGNELLEQLIIELAK